MFKQILSITILSITVTGCMSQAPEIDQDFGAAVKHNIAMQTINPDATRPDDSTSIDGNKARQAVESYRAAPVEAEVESLIQNVGEN